MVDYLANTEINSQAHRGWPRAASGHPGSHWPCRAECCWVRGVLTKECRKKAKPRIFFLFSDILVCAAGIVLNKRRVPQPAHHSAGGGDTGEAQETLQAKNRWMIK